MDDMNKDVAWLGLPRSGRQKLWMIKGIFKEEHGVI